MSQQYVFKNIYVNESELLQFDDIANNTEVIMTLNGEQNLNQLFDAFMNFLHASGFHFKDGDYIGVMNDHDNEYNSKELSLVPVDSGDQDIPF
jgi:hypothetical protein